jgi:hypothetical protein
LGNYIPRPKYKQLVSLKVAAISLKSLVSNASFTSPELNLIPASTYENQSDNVPFALLSEVRSLLKQ